ncbi:MAG: addiction module protein [Pyrinomonadaceae bacterium]
MRLAGRFGKNVWLSRDRVLEPFPFISLELSFNHDRRITRNQGLKPQPDRLELITKVWDTLAPEDLPVTDAERVLLDARLADMEAHPDDQSLWPEVKARLERLTS